MSRRIRVSATILAFAAITAAWPARAGDPAAAEALFREGRALARDGKWQGACEKFKESQRLDPAVGTLLNVAHCEAALGKLASAWEHYRAVLDDLPRDDERVAHVRAQLAALEPRLPRLTVVLASGAHGARVARDGSVLGEAALGAPLPVDPGEHEIVVTAPGTKPRRYAVTAKEGEAKTISVELGPASQTEPEKPTATPAPAPAVASRPAPAPARDQGTSSRTTWGYVIGGVGVAGLVVGAGAGALALSKKGTVRDHCDADYNCDASGVDAASSGKRWATVSTVAFAVGAAGVGVGAYWILSGNSKVGAATSGDATLAFVSGRF
jgi:Tetratricopeptide repeat